MKSWWQVSYNPEGLGTDTGLSLGTLTSPPEALFAYDTLDLQDDWIACSWLLIFLSNIVTEKKRIYCYLQFGSVGLKGRKMVTRDLLKL